MKLSQIAIATLVLMCLDACTSLTPTSTDGDVTMWQVASTSDASHTLSANWRGDRADPWGYSNLPFGE